MVLAEPADFTPHSNCIPLLSGLKKNLCHPAVGAICRKIRNFQKIGTQNCKLACISKYPTESTFPSKFRSNDMIDHDILCAQDIRLVQIFKLVGGMMMSTL